MIETIWQQHPTALLILWVALSLVWQWGLPQGSTRWLDRAYPLFPLAVVGIAVASPLAAAFLVDFLQLGLWLWIWLTVVWLVSVVKRDASIMDIAYGGVLVAAPWWLFQHWGGSINWSGISLGSLTGSPVPSSIPSAIPMASHASSLLLLAMTTLGFGRYTLYILWRNLPHGEDPRYARWRQRAGNRFWWWSYFQIFLLQGVIIWFWATPLALGMAAPGPIGFWHTAGALVWLVGFVFEAGGDWQLTHFKRHRKDPSQLLNTGLWGLTRHPNYFGQTCMWWGYGVFALAHPWGWLSVFPLAYVTWFMNKGSATSLMERHMVKTKPGYAHYCATVPAFFPRLRLRSAAARSTSASPK